MPPVKVKRKQPRSLRVIAGTWRGRRIVFPDDTDVRPTPDRVRETLFNWLCEHVEGARCLDLFAGSGILGFEALSRGAREAWLIEHDARLAAGIAAQASALGASAARVLNLDAQAFLESATQRFDVVFLDPPYALPLEPLVGRLQGVLADGALVYFERAAKEGLPRTDAIQWRKRSRAAGVAFGLAELAAARPA